MKNPRERKDSGVSEVIGTILTLGITVTLFSTVFLMLGRLPAPTGTTYANFDMDATKMSDGSVWINITHKGGETLYNKSTTIYVIADNNTVYSYSIWDGLHSKEWKPGMIWSYHVQESVPIDMSTGYIYIFDTNRNSIIWRENFAGGISTPLPPIIMNRGTTPSLPSTSSKFQIYAYIKDPNDDFTPGDGKSSLTVDVSGIKLCYSSNSTPASHVRMHHDVGYRYVTPYLNASSRTPVGSHLAEIRAKDDHNQTAKGIVSFVIGHKSTSDCDIYISQIEFSPQSPVTGETTQIRVTFANAGNSYGYCIPYIYDHSPTGVSNITDEVMSGSKETRYVQVAAHGESTRTYTWINPSPAGNHQIEIYASIPANAPNDYNITNNTASQMLSVIPKILLVDDDHNKDFNTAAYMMDALNATGYTYDVYTVAYDTDDGPQIGTLSKYDVVIWMTGKDTAYSLTRTKDTGDLTNLEAFLNNGGKLWLIGENIMENRYTPTFMNDYLGVTREARDVSLPSMINGSSPTLPGIANITLAPTGYNNGKYTDYISTSQTTAHVALYDTSNHKAVAISNDDGTYKTMFFSFEFSTIKYASDRAEITYETLKWLSGITGRTGRDVAVGGVTMDPEYPLYKDNVNITISIRNNGWKKEWVRVQLLVDGADYAIEHELPNKTIEVGKNGGINITWGHWDATTLGTHNLVVKVDPYNEIAETDETNNIYATSFIVRFRTLIVDDDDSANNGGSQSDWNSTIVNSFKHLLSSRDLASNYSATSDIWVVHHGQNGPNYANMSRYNAVIWITGADDTNSFTYADMKNITLYLQSSGMFWAIGSGFINDLHDGVAGASSSDISSFLNKIGVSSYSQDAASGFGELTGTLNDPITHGIDFTMDTSSTLGADMLTPSYNADGILLGDGGYVAVKCENTYKSIVMTFNPNATTGLENYYPDAHFQLPSDIANRTTYEIVYRVMHWFGEINTNPEMMVGSDLYINGQPIDRAHLVLGNSYILEARVHNIGSEDIIYANVRFYDGNFIIASSSIGVRAGNVSTVSVVWKPAYAGAQRPIRVIVDYYQEVQEIPNPDNMSQNLFEYNNEIVHYVPVYFFWDDMENGTANWLHTANVVNINGENPIDFLGGGYKNIYTDVVYRWNESMSYGGEWIDTTYHSYNRSYWLKEPSPTGAPVDQTKNEPIPIDVVFALDTSGSMNDQAGGSFWNPISKWDYAKEAAENFIKNLTDNDRAAIWIFDGNGHPKKLIPTDPNGLSYMTAQNKKSFIDALENVNPNGGTPFYDMLGDAIQNSLVYDSDCTNNNRLEFVVSMTDGESNSDTEWSPHAKWGETTTSGGGSSGSGTYKGLLNAPPMVFTIGLLDSKYHDSNYPTAPNWAHYPHPDPNTDSKHIEYDLWHCADSSLTTRGQYGRDYNRSSPGYDAFDSDPNEDFTNPDPNIGHYYYTQNANQLNDIFTDIRNMVVSIATGNGQAASNGNVTRSGGITFKDAGSISGTRSTSGAPATDTVVTVFNADFESTTGDNAWTHGGSNDDWQRGNPYSYSPHSGSNCWGTQISSTGWPDYDHYNSNENAWLKSPPIDLTSATSATLSWWRLYHIEKTYDHGYAEISKDGGSTWTKLKTYTGDHESWTQDSVDISSYVGNTIYIRFRLESDGSQQYQGLYVDDVKVDADVPPPPSITITSPSSGDTWQAGISHTITWTTSNPSGAAITGVDLYYSTDGGTTWTNIVTGTTDDGSYDWTPPNSAVTDHAKIKAIVHDSNNEKGTDTSPEFKIIPGPAAVLKVFPASGKVAIPSQYVTVIFDSTMASTTPTLQQTKGTDPGNWHFEGWFTTYKTHDTAIWSHDNWTAAQSVTMKVSNYHAASGNTNSGADYSWTFKTYTFTSTGGTGQTEKNTNKTAVTDSFDLSNVKGAYLTFWHKYNIVPGMNGAFLELGYNKSGDWQWIYIIPGQGAYTGNLNLSDTHRKDSEGTPIVYGWNGVSGKGTFSWEFVKVDLMGVVTKHVPQQYRHEIRIKFNYTQYGLGTGYGWYIDDVKVVVTRSDSAAVTSGDSDIWQVVSTTDRNGNPTHAWWNGDPSTGLFKPGIDNSLISRPIDLTNAWNATLSAYFKFNINTSSGAPPDGFRVEISTDGGVTWTAINLGVRSAWGVSGSDNSGTQTVTGVNAGNNWVEAGSLTRLNVDLTAFRGNVIMLRFRVVTTSADNYQHYDKDTGWGGFYLDDVVISGESL